MSEITEYKPGTFCWVELCTSDAAGAKKFYGELFERGMNDQPIGDDAFYTMTQLKGKDIGALYESNKGLEAQGVPPHGFSCISVASADETAAKAKSIGGTLLREPFDAGRSAQPSLSHRRIFQKLAGLPLPATRRAPCFLLSN